MTEIKSEVETFELATNLIYHVIFGQAGSVEKGLLESIQNSYDAKASSIDIELYPDGSGYSVTDDGRGFESREQIKAWFKKIGWDHAELGANQREVGRFGLGRAQLWSFSRNVWTTNRYRLDIDVKARGLDYLVNESPDILHKGCKIEGTFYEPMDVHALNICVRELESLAKFCPIPVKVNGRQINTTPSDAKWTLETDEAYFQLKANSSRLAVYNLGFLVREYNAADFGVGGVVVSKQPLSLNIARNDVLKSKCPYFPKISKTLRQHSIASASNTKLRLTNQRREALCREWVNGTVSYSEIKDLKLLPTMLAHTTIERMSHYDFTVAEHNGDPLAEYIQRTEATVVLSPDVLGWFSVTNEAELSALMKTCFERDCPDQYRLSANYLFRFVEFKSISKGFSRDAKQVAPRDLTDRQKASVCALRTMAPYVVSAGYRAGLEHKRRTIDAGILDGAVAWTDGVSRITFHIDTLEQAVNDENAFWQLLHTLCHEQCHADSDADAHNHDQEFFESFHDLLDNLNVQATLQKGYASANAYLKSRKVRVPVWLQRAASKGVKDGEIVPEFSEDEDGGEGGIQSKAA